MNDDYTAGFSDGFAAAIRQGLPRSTRTIAEGFKNGPEKNRKIAIALSDELFKCVRDRAYHNQRSFAAEIRAILEGYGLESN